MNPKDRQHILRRLGTTPVKADEYPGIRKAMTIIEEDAALIPQDESLKTVRDWLSYIPAPQVSTLEQSYNEALKAIEDKNRIIKAQEDFIQRQHKDSTEKFKEIRDLKFKLAASQEQVKNQADTIARKDRDIDSMQWRINNNFQVKNHLENLLRDRDREIAQLKTEAARRKWGRRR